MGAPLEIALNHDLIREMLDGIGAEAVRELSIFYITETRARVPEMRAFFDAKNFSELKRSAHSLKGASYTYGIITLAEIANQLEQAANAEDLESAVASLAWIEENTEAAISLLTAYLDEKIKAG